MLLCCWIPFLWQNESLLLNMEMALQLPFSTQRKTELIREKQRTFINKEEKRSIERNPFRHFAASPFRHFAFSPFHFPLDPSTPIPTDNPNPQKTGQ